jgi:hypothetical protein
LPHVALHLLDGRKQGAGMAFAVVTMPQRRKDSLDLASDALMDDSELRPVLPGERRLREAGGF